MAADRILSSSCTALAITN